MAAATLRLNDSVTSALPNWIIVHAEGVGVLLLDVGQEEGNLIHAAGVRVGFPSSEPKARHVGGGDLTALSRWVRDCEASTLRLSKLAAV
jgi:hypothetical protein